MKKTLFLFVFSLALTFVSCGPAAENRQMMHERAKVFQDSIAKVLKTAMAEAEAPVNNVVTLPAPAPTTTAVSSSTVK